MINERTTALFDLLEAQARLGLSEIASLRQRVATLEAENRRLREALESQQALVSSVEEPPTPAVRDYPSPQRGAAVATGSSDDANVVEAQAQAQAQAETEAPEPPVSDTSKPEPPADAAPQAEEELPSPQALLNEWYRRYTNTFFKGHTRPLKVGIHEDLLAREPWPEKLVRRALACYVHLPRYLKAVRPGIERVDLDGQPAGTVNDEEAQHARKKLDGLQARQRERDKGRKDKTEAKRHARLDEKLSELLAKHGGRQ
ncbi:ProQ/FINO family protein [Modicisalibacter xianhensis]|uniref:ProP effector n=1 Tax=Modicisalibacter xianhensis TaxID=442341 RepID=A0A1I2YDV3_9GAMM|nr:ProQ/FINO family protein [Halomonas xianhensis]SFH22591.1 ProP effector [Halomonas xianhensis]